MKTGIGNRTVGIVLALAALCLPWSAALATPIWEVIPSAMAIGNFDEDRPGDESIISYLVQNTSAPGDANNLIQFSLTAPGDMRLWYVERPSGWTYDNSVPNVIIFSGNGNYIPPGNEGTFTIFSYHTQTAQGTANAISEGTGGNPNVPFSPLTTTVPVIPEPGTVALGILGAAAFLSRRCRGVISRKGNPRNTKGI